MAAVSYCTCQDPWAAHLYPQSPRGNTARVTESTQPRVHSWGSSKACQHFHKAVCDSLHLHCQVACPGVPPISWGVRLFSLWITPDMQKQSASECLFCTFMDDLCCVVPCLVIGAWQGVTQPPGSGVPSSRHRVSIETSEAGLACSTRIFYYVHPRTIPRVAL